MIYPNNCEWWLKSMEIKMGFKMWIYFLYLNQTCYTYNQLRENEPYWFSGSKSCWTDWSCMKMPSVDWCWLCLENALLSPSWCRGVIVMLLWFPPYESPLHHDLVNVIEIKWLCTSSLNFPDVLAMMIGLFLLILEVRGQRSQHTRKDVTLSKQKRSNCQINWNLFLSNLTQILLMMRGWTLLILGGWGQRSIDKSGNKLVNTIKIKLFSVFSSYLAQMFSKKIGWTQLILEVRGQRSRSQQLKAI